MLAFGTAEQSARWSHLLGWGGPLQRSPPSPSGVGAACFIIEAKFFHPNPKGGISMSLTAVTTRSGALSGLDMGSYAVFKGVPYAAPPVGPLRWKRPQP